MSHPKPLATHAGAITQLEAAELSVGDAMSLARVYAGMLTNQEGEITLSGDGLFLLFRGIQEKCDQASRALAELRGIVTAATTN